MTYPHVLLIMATLIIVLAVWLAYEVGCRVGAYEEQRQYTRREPQWFSDDNEPF